MTVAKDGEDAGGPKDWVGGAAGACRVGDNRLGTWSWIWLWECWLNRWGW